MIVLLVLVLGSLQSPGCRGYIAGHQVVKRQADDSAPNSCEQNAAFCKFLNDIQISHDTIEALDELFKKDKNAETANALIQAYDTFNESSSYFLPRDYNVSYLADESFRKALKDHFGDREKAKIFFLDLVRLLTNAAKIDVAVCHMKAFHSQGPSTQAEMRPHVWSELLKITSAIANNLYEGWNDI